MTTSPLDIASALRFLKALGRNNTRDWFAANRARYDAEIKPAFADFVAALLIAAIKFDERFAHVDPNRCIFRIYRDIRFSPDKTPYKTYLSAFLSPYGWRGTTPGFYIAIEPGGKSLFAAGIYTPEKPILTQLRERIAHGDVAFERIVKQRRLARYLPIDTDPLVRMPRGLPPDHPRAELLRARRYMVRRSFSDTDLQRSDALQLFRTAMYDTAPFVGWLDESLRGCFEPLDSRLE